MLLSGNMTCAMFYKKMTSEKLLSQSCMTKIIDNNLYSLQGAKVRSSHLNY